MAPTTVWELRELDSTLTQYFALDFFRDSHGGTASSSFQRPRRDSLASLSSRSNVSSLEYFRYLQARPFRTISRFKLRSSGRTTSPRVLPYLSRPRSSTITSLPKESSDAVCFELFPKACLLSSRADQQKAELVQKQILPRAATKGSHTTLWRSRSEWSSPATS
jgi:hypothetical protein